MDREFASFNVKKKNTLRCGTIIFNEDCTHIVVILNRFSYEMGENKWGLPKGGLDKDEKYVDCAIRETLEETGLKIKIKSDSAILNIGKTRYFPIILDQKTCTEKFNPVDTDEIYAVQWHSIDKLRMFKKKHTNHELKIFLSTNNISQYFFFNSEL